jgi:nucleoside-diphosphate-sugar epimerase
MKVLVAGANGQTARQLVRILVEDGHEVRGLIRKEEQTENVKSDGAEPMLVDFEQDEADGKIGDAVEGCDAVIFAAGAREQNAT